MLYEGDGIPQSYKDAYTWFMVAKENGVEVPADVLKTTKDELSKEELEAAKQSIESFNKRMKNKS